MDVYSILKGLKDNERRVYDEKQKIEKNKRTMFSRRGSLSEEQGEFAIQEKDPEYNAILDKYCLEFHEHDHSEEEDGVPHGHTL